LMQTFSSHSCVLIKFVHYKEPTVKGLADFLAGVLLQAMGTVYVYCVQDMHHLFSIIMLDCGVH